MKTKPSSLIRIGIFYDGTFFWRISNHYKHRHERSSYLSIDGLHDFIRARVAKLETDGNADLCKITEAHFFRGRFSLKSVQAMKDPVKQLEVDRFQDQILMHSSIVAHYHPMNEALDPPEEKGIDVWMALEAYDLAAHKNLDVVVLVSGDSDFVPLIRKLNGLGTRVMVVAVNLEGSAKTSQKLMDEASYTLMLSEEIDVQTDPRVEGLFR